jgi:two-component system NtrC family sensor kinase
MERRREAIDMQFEEFDSVFFRHRVRAPAPAEAASPLVRLQYLVDNTPAIIYCTVPSGDFKMTFVSNNAFNVLGYRPEQMVADPNFWFDHIHPDDAPAIFSSLALVFTEGQRAYEYRFRIHDGSYLWMHDTLRLIRDEHGAPLEVIGSLTDITARKRMEEALAGQGRRAAATDRRIAQRPRAAAAIGKNGVDRPTGGRHRARDQQPGRLRQFQHGLAEELCRHLAGRDRPVPAGGRRPSGAGGATGGAARRRRPGIPEGRRHRPGARINGRPQAGQGYRSGAEGFSHVGETEWQVADLHHGWTAR